MSLTELLPSVQSLPRSDKLRLIQYLATELAHEEVPPTFEDGAQFPIWSPYNAFDAANILLQAIQAEGQNS